MTVDTDRHPAPSSATRTSAVSYAASDLLDPRPPRLHRWLERLAAASFAFLLFVVCLFLFTRHNDFPYHYHADEGSKAQQVLSWRDARNHNHPQLLLEATEWATQWLATPPDAQAVVEVGRWCSAAFTATGVVAVACIGYASAGLVGMVLVGAVVGLSPQLLTYAHYMKEDAALTFGLMVTLLGSRLTWDARRWWTKIPALTLLGVGAALAAGGKYVGLLAFVLAVPVALAAPRIRWFLRPLAGLWVGVVGVALLLTINHRAINDWETAKAEYAYYTRPVDGQAVDAKARAIAAWKAVFHDEARDGFMREKNHAGTEHGGLTMDRPNTFFLGLFPVEVMPHALVLAGAYVVLVAASLFRRGRRDGWGVAFIVFVGVFVLALSYSVIPFHRYFLPVSMMTYLAAGLALAWLVDGIPAAIARRWHGRRGPVRAAKGDGESSAAARADEPATGASSIGTGLRLTLAAVGLLLIVGVQSTRCVTHNRQFADDSRARLRHWIAANLPADAVILAEGYTGLDHPPDSRPGHETPALPQRIIIRRFAADAGEIDRVRRWQGVRYVAVTDLSYARFFVPQVRAVPGQEHRLTAGRAWYTQLADTHDLIWSYDPPTNLHAFTNPSIRLYRLRP